MLKCIICGHPISPAVEKYCDRIMAGKNLSKQYYCMSCQVDVGINMFDPRKFNFEKEEKVMKKKLHVNEMFRVKEFERVIKIKQVNSSNPTEVHKHVVWSCLKLLNHLDMLPRGYFTRVVNKNIGFVAASKKVAQIMPHSSYIVRTCNIGEVTFIGLIETPYDIIRGTHDAEGNYVSVY